MAPTERSSRSFRASSPASWSALLLVLAFGSIVAAACGRSGLDLVGPSEGSGGMGASGSQGSTTGTQGPTTSSTGGGGPCTAPTDCNDFEECTTDTCDNGQCVFTP